MLNLLRADIYNLRKSRLLPYIILAGAIATAGLALVVNYIVKNGLMTADVNTTNSYIFGFNLTDISPLKLSGFDVAYRMSSGGDLIPILIGVLACVFVTNEFSNGTIKNILSVGYKKSSFYFSKLLVICIVSTAATLLMAAVAFITGGVCFGFGEPGVDAHIGDFILMLGIQSLLHAGFASLFLFIAALLRNSAASISACVGIILFVRLLLAVIDRLLDAGGDIYSYWISSNITALVTRTPASETLVKASLVGFAYIAVTAVLGGYLFTRRDVN